MSEKLKIVRGYKKGWEVFEVKYKGTNYNKNGLAKLSKLIIECDDKDEDDGLFNISSSVNLKFGNTEKAFTFEALDLYNDAHSILGNKLSSRFSEIMIWKDSLNQNENFTINI